MSRKQIDQKIRKQVYQTYNAHYFGPKGGCFPQILSIKEILAIQKQIEELGCEFTYECKRNV